MAFSSLSPTTSPVRSIYRKPIINTKLPNTPKSLLSLQGNLLSWSISVSYVKKLEAKNAAIFVKGLTQKRQGQPNTMALLMFNLLRLKMLTVQIHIFLSKYTYSFRNLVKFGEYKIMAMFIESVDGVVGSFRRSNTHIPFDIWSRVWALLLYIIRIPFGIWLSVCDYLVVYFTYIFPVEFHVFSVKFHVFLVEFCL